MLVCSANKLNKRYVILLNVSKETEVRDRVEVENPVVISWGKVKQGEIS